MSQCTFAGCVNEAIYGNPRGFASRCPTHKDPGMVAVVNKICQRCRKLHASYGYPNDVPVRCRGCMEIDMVDLRRIRR